MIYLQVKLPEDLNADVRHYAVDSKQNLTEAVIELLSKGLTAIKEESEKAS